MIDKKTGENLSKTYEEVAIEWLGELDHTDTHVSKFFNDTENTQNVKEDFKEIVIRFAHWLDKFNTIDMHMELIMMRATQKVDRRFMQALIEEVGVDRAKELAEINIGITTPPVENPISTEDKEC